MYCHIILFVVAISFKNPQAAPACNCGLGSGISVCSGGGGIIDGGGGGIIGGGGGGGSIGGPGGGSGVIITGPGGVGGGRDGDDAPGGCGCYPLVVRPRTLPVINPEFYTKPRVVCKTIPGSGIKPLSRGIGNLCSFGKTIVKPAHVPRPSCAFCSGGSGGPGGSGSGGTSGGSGGSGGPGTGSLGGSGLQPILTSSQILQSGPFSIDFSGCGPPIVHQGPRTPLSSALVDAVSLEISQRESRQRESSQADRKLLFGFAKTPEEGACQYDTTPKRNEGNIHAIRGPVLEFKFTQGGGRSPEDEELELLEAQEEEEAEEEEATGPDVRLPTMGEIGFAPANYNSGQFVNLESQVPDVLVSTSSCGGGGGGVGGGVDEYRPPCRDGFKSGEVIIQEGVVSSGIPDQNPSYVEDDDDDGVGSGGYFDFPRYPPADQRPPRGYYPHSGRCS